MLTPDISVASTSPAASPLAKVPEAYAPWISLDFTRRYAAESCMLRMLQQKLLTLVSWIMDAKAASWGFFLPAHQAAWHVDRC